MVEDLWKGTGSLNFPFPVFGTGTRPGPLFITVCIECYTVVHSLACVTMAISPKAVAYIATYNYGALY
jgi:hypothetical protein